jgi:hypothetical protein
MPGKEQVPRHVAGPRFAQRSCEREQYRTRCQRDHGAALRTTFRHASTTKRFRRQQRFDLFEQKGPLRATGNQACRGRIQNEDALSTSAVSAGMHACRAARSARASAARAALVLQAPHRDARNHQLVSGSGRGRKGCRVELGQRIRSASSRRPIRRRRRISR